MAKPSSSRTPSSKYDVQGFILNFGEALPAAARRRILVRLRAEVPAFAALTTP